MHAVRILDGLRVLAVDDDADNLELIKIILEQFHAQVIPAASVIEALEVITWWKPNILISNIAMPIEDGYSLIRQVRNLALHVRHIPAIAMTTLASSKVSALALNAGFSTCIMKPFDPDELVAVALKLARDRVIGTMSITSADG